MVRTREAIDAAQAVNERDDETKAVVEIRDDGTGADIRVTTMQLGVVPTEALQPKSMTSIRTLDKRTVKVF